MPGPQRRCRRAGSVALKAPRRAVVSSRGAGACGLRGTRHRAHLSSSGGNKLLGAASRAAPTCCSCALFFRVENLAQSLRELVTGWGTPQLPAQPQALCPGPFSPSGHLAQEGTETKTPVSEAEFLPLLLHL